MEDATFLLWVFNWGTNRKDLNHIFASWSYRPNSADLVVLKINKKTKTQQLEKLKLDNFVNWDQFRDIWMLVTIMGLVYSSGGKENEPIPK